MVLHQLSGDMEITFYILFCAYRIIISVETLVKTATHRRCGKVLTNIPTEMDKSSSTKEAISEYRNSDFQFSGSAISSHKNIQMARTRKTSKEALEEKIKKAEADVIAAKKKYDQATANLKELLDKRDAIRKEEILSAVVKSGRSYEEIMNFLNAGSDGEKTEK